MKQLKNFKALSIVAFFAMACLSARAQNDVIIKAAFVPDKNTQQIVPDKTATDDEVIFEFVDTDNVTYDTDAGQPCVILAAGAEFAITANTFKNIQGVMIYTPVKEENCVSIVSAEGTGFSDVSELNDAIRYLGTSKPYASCYFRSARLSEVRFEVLREVTVLEVDVNLDVETDFAIEDNATIYADEPVPFVKKSNSVDYLYAIDPKEPNEDDEYSVVPEDGIKLTGLSAGQHVVYLNVDNKDRNDSRSVIVNYNPTAPTTEIQNIEANEAVEYFDLTGRRVTPTAGHLVIRKTAAGSTLIRL